MQKLSVLILVFCIVFLVIGLLPVHGEGEIYSDVLRLHVLANSDSEEDQALKLKVRDALLSASEPLLADCRTRDEAEHALRENIPLLEQTAKETLAAHGCDDSVAITLNEEVYPTRNYESFCFPSGRYLSLRVMIGEAEGQNWWCVLFPPMCLGAASKQETEDAYISVGFTGEQYRVITQTERPAYQVRFRLLEVIEEATRK